MKNAKIAKIRSRDSRYEYLGHRGYSDEYPEAPKHPEERNSGTAEQRNTGARDPPAIQTAYPIVTFTRDASTFEQKSK
jgi:hypothetical protein